MLGFPYSQVLSSPRHGLRVPPCLSLGEIRKPGPSVPVELNPCLCTHARSAPYAPGLAQELPSLCALPLCEPSYVQIPLKPGRIGAQAVTTNPGFPEGLELDFGAV